MKNVTILLFSYVIFAVIALWVTIKFETFLAPLAFWVVTVITFISLCHQGPKEGLKP